MWKLQTSRKLTSVPLHFFNIFSAKCIDHYTKQCVENAELPEGEKKPVDERLEGIVNKMFQRCLDDHKYKQAIGIALETRRLDIFEKTILESVRARSRSEVLCCFGTWTVLCGQDKRWKLGEELMQFLWRGVSWGRGFTSTYSWKTKLLKTMINQL